MSVDIVIIGGGVVGSAVAYFLARTGRAGKVAVVEPDPRYAFSATPAANGGIRQLFSLSENILMARYGLDFFAEFHRVMAADCCISSLRSFRRADALKTPNVNRTDQAPLARCGNRWRNHA